MGKNSTEYNEFLDSKKPRHTTDDCHTPPLIYTALMEWLHEEFPWLKNKRIRRPFKPGGDYVAAMATYGDNDVVVDNPPFSICAQIIRDYCKRGVKFFLFAPGLTVFQYATNPEVSFVFAGDQMTFDNGANINVEFVTNLYHIPVIKTAPKLRCNLQKIRKEMQHNLTRTLPKYYYPNEVLTAAAVKKISNKYVDLEIPRAETIVTKAMDHQRTKKKSIFGSGFYLSERAAAERAAAEKWVLTEREWKLIKGLNNNKK